MSAAYPAVPRASSWTVAQVFFPAGTYRHPPTGLVQLRLVRRGSSCADIDLGLGLGARRVFTRPGDLLLTLPNRPTMFRIDDGRELTLLQVLPALATRLLRQCGGRSLDDLLPLLRRPVREPLVAEILRRLEGGEPQTAAPEEWALGVVFSSLLRAARKVAVSATLPALSAETLNALLARVAANLTEHWPVDRLAGEAGLSRRTFAAAFKGAKGMSVHQYILRLRADHAAALLRETKLPFAEVALQSGFANQAHMTRAMNRLTRQTPGRIRGTN
ncbi:helix-turn-helix domain-containing protein [Mycobacterium sp. ML4]